MSGKGRIGVEANLLAAKIGIVFVKVVEAVLIPKRMPATSSSSSESCFDIEGSICNLLIYCRQKQAKHQSIFFSFPLQNVEKDW